MSAVRALARHLLPLILLGGGALAKAPPVALVPVLATTGGNLTYLLGGWQDGRWLTDTQAAARMGAATYQAWTLSRATGTARGERPDSMGEPCIEILRTQLRPRPPEDTLRVYLPASLRAVPRPVQALPTGNSTYTEIVRADLRRRGIAQPQVRVTGLTRADLDGDGTQEVLIEARYFQEKGRAGNAFSPPASGQSGDYSLLLVRFVREGQAVTSTLAGYLGPKLSQDPTTAPLLPRLYRLAGLADVNGDGRMEIIMYDAYYEGQGFGVYEWSPTGGAKLRLDTGCGV